MKILQNHDRFKLSFIDIAKGSSFSRDAKLFIKHSNDFDLAELIQQKDIYVSEEISDAHITEEIKLNLLKQQGLWGDKDEDDRLSLEMTITTNRSLAEKMPVPSQREMINVIIKQKEKELEELQSKRDELVGFTDGFYGSKFMSELIISSSFFQDRGCSQKAYSEEQFEALPNERVSVLNKSYSKFLEDFSQKTLRSLACLPFFLNQLAYSKKNLSNFFGKPIVQFSHFQLDLVGKGLRNLNILENSESEPPDIEENTDIQEVLDWYDSNYSILLGKRKSNSDTSGVTKSKTYVKTR